MEYRCCCSAKIHKKLFLWKKSRTGAVRRSPFAMRYGFRLHGLNPVQNQPEHGSRECGKMSEGGKMRTFALYSIAALAISIMTPAAVWAWSSEQAAPKGADGADLADSEDALKALQDKVDSKTSDKSGFYISGGTDQQMVSPYGFRSNQTGSGVPFGYSPFPGFRGQAN